MDGLRKRISSLCKSESAVDKLSDAEIYSERAGHCTVEEDDYEVVKELDTHSLCSVSDASNHELDWTILKSVDSNSDAGVITDSESSPEVYKVSETQKIVSISDGVESICTTGSDDDDSANSVLVCSIPTASTQPQWCSDPNQLKKAEELLNAGFQHAFNLIHDSTEVNVNEESRDVSSSPHSVASSGPTPSPNDNFPLVDICSDNSLNYGSFGHYPDNNFYGYNYYYPYGYDWPFTGIQYHSPVTMKLFGLQFAQPKFMYPYGVKHNAFQPSPVVGNMGTNQEISSASGFERIGPCKSRPCICRFGCSSSEKDASIECKESLLSGAEQKFKVLDSFLVKDVEVIDGTTMKPRMTFTKVWRMCNNGTVAWPQGVKLTWIGGNSLNTKPAVIVKVPLEGLPVGKEIDISIKATAPAFPGEFASYWRMALPSGSKFGQVVSFDIKVENSTETSTDSLRRLNRNCYGLFGGSSDPKSRDDSLNLPGVKSEPVKKTGLNGISSAKGDKCGASSLKYPNGSEEPHEGEKKESKFECKVKNSAGHQNPREALRTFIKNYSSPSVVRNEKGKEMACSSKGSDQSCHRKGNERYASSSTNTSEEPRVSKFHTDSSSKETGVDRSCSPGNLSSYFDEKFDKVRSHIQLLNHVDASRSFATNNKATKPNDGRDVNDNAASFRSACFWDLF